MIAREPGPGGGHRGASPERRARSRRAPPGFTLIEVSVALAVAILLTSVAVPVMTAVLTENRNEGAQASLTVLKNAIRTYCDNTGVMPASLDHLVEPHGVAGWRGPYVAATNDARDARIPRDPWGNPFLWTIANARSGVLTCTGANAHVDVGEGDDLLTPVDVTDLLRVKTLNELDQLNAAIRNYNGVNLPGAPLPADIVTLVTQLIAQGFLQGSVSGWSRDAFGQLYVPGPAPVQQVSFAGLP